MSATSIATAPDSLTGNRDGNAASFLASSAESNIDTYAALESHGDIDPNAVDHSQSTTSNAVGTKHPTELPSPVDATISNGLFRAEHASNANADQPEKAAVALHIPEDILQILTEVARKGMSSVLPWRSEVKPLTERSIRDRPFPPDARGGGPAKQEYYRSNDRNKNHSHKRSRASMSSRNRSSISDRQKLHRSYFSSSSGGRSTTTSTMVVEPSTSVVSTAKNKGYPMNGAHPVGGPTSNLFLIRTTQSTSVPSPSLSSLFSPGSAGSGRTSGSEHEDTSQYECDSEGTSATSNSELSFSTNSFTKGGGFVRSSKEGNRTFGVVKREPKYSSLKDALTFSLNSILDFYYQNRGGYKLSPAEKRKYSRMGVHSTIQDKESIHHSAEWNMDEIFQNRKKHILDMLGRYCDTGEQRGATASSATVGDILPPFTIQRIAEVLMEPERYYTQTHKLCNCMEKLLLVTSSASAFGALIGKDTSPVHREETESTALSEEKTRLRSEFRQSHRRTRRKTDSVVLADKAEMRRRQVKEEKGINEPLVLHSPNDKASPKELPLGADDVDESQEPSSVSAKDAAAEEALEAAARATLRTKFDHVGIDPHSSAALANSRDVLALIESRRLTNSPPPPSSSGLRPHGHRSPPSPPSPELLRRMSSPRVPSPVLFSSLSERLSSSPPPMAPSLAHPHALSFSAARNALLSHAGRDAELGSRSPTSSEDLDSTESDFDDSASDRSDSSDSEARTLARNRMQQQLQGRVRTSVPRTRAEDSGESDASDPAD